MREWVVEAFFPPATPWRCKNRRDFSPASIWTLGRRQFFRIYSTNRKAIVEKDGYRQRERRYRQRKGLWEQHIPRAYMWCGGKTDKPNCPTRACRLGKGIWGFKEAWHKIETQRAFAWAFVPVSYFSFWVESADVLRTTKPTWQRGSLPLTQEVSWIGMQN